MIKKYFRDNKIHKKIVPKFDLLFLPNLIWLFAVWTLLSVGMVSAELHSGDIEIWQTQFNWITIVIFIAFSLRAGAANLLFQITYPKSFHNSNIKSFVGDKYSEEKIKKLANILGVMSIILLFIKPILLLMGITLFFVWSILLNSQKFKWYSNPILGVVGYFLIASILFISGWLIVDDSLLNISDILISMLPYSLSFVALTILVMVDKLKIDAEANYQTFAVEYGRQKSQFISLILVIIASVLSFILSDPLFTTASLVALPFFIYLNLHNKRIDLLRTIRYSILILTFFAFSVYSLLLLASFILFYISKYYYWHRFDIHYPAFVIENEND